MQDNRIRGVLTRLTMLVVDEDGMSTVEYAIIVLYTP